MKLPAPLTVRSAMLRPLLFPALRSPALRSPMVTALMAAPLLALGLTACSASKDELAYVERPPEQIYAEAATAMEDQEYKKSAKLFDEVERQHPYSQWATRAQLMAAYSHYQNVKYDDAVLALERYIQLHPGSEQVGYAYYLKGLCYYEQITDIGRDQKITKQALDALSEVVRRFPESEYSRDAKLKIDLTTDHLAGKEMEIGRFYLRQQNYMAALGRFRNVVDNYQTTSHTAEALHRLVECYLSVGLNSEARRAAAILGHNFPGTDWYEDSYSLLASLGQKPDHLKSVEFKGAMPAPTVIGTDSGGQEPSKAESHRIPTEADGEPNQGLISRAWDSLLGRDGHKSKPAKVESPTIEPAAVVEPVPEPAPAPAPPAPKAPAPQAQAEPEQSGPQDTKSFWRKGWDSIF